MMCKTKSAAKVRLFFDICKKNVQIFGGKAHFPYGNPSVILLSSFGEVRYYTTKDNAITSQS